jgi:hypothetical protein
MTLLTLAAVLVLVAIAIPAFAAEQGGRFVDDNGNQHEANIEAIAAVGVTKGCNPPTNDRYCPKDTVTRQQMASFLVRAFKLPPTSKDFFIDDETSVHEGDINALAAAGVTKGCNPPSNDRFCPTQTVSREQMASFIKRAGGYPSVGTDYFSDDNGSIHEGDINAIAAKGITVPCGFGSYCPTSPMFRDVMATMLARALGLKPISPPPSPKPPSPEQPPYEVIRLKDLGTTQLYHVVAVGEAIRDDGGGEYDFTDGTATVELELKGETRTVPLNTCLVVTGSPEGGSDLSVRDAYGNPDGHGVVNLGVRCPRGIDDL